MQLHTYDDFTPLREIIVGSAENYLSHDRDVTFELFHHENLTGFRSDWAYPRLAVADDPAVESWRIRRRYTEELHEDVEALADTLRQAGVRVHRPLPLPPDAAPIAGLGWQAAPTPALNIRDNTLILGDEIIETPPAIRSRYLETRLLAPVFSRYHRAGARWTTMPRPVLTDLSFDLSYARHATTTLGGPTEPISDPQPSPYDVGFEMILDGAQVLRLGRDLVVNIATENHRMAVDWLERHVEGRFTIHRVHRMADNHIDSMLLALRPGVFLARHDGIRELLPEPLQSWKFIVPPEPDPGAFPSYDERDLVLTSPYIDLNVLSLDPDTVLVNQDCPGLRKTLDSAGFTTVPVRHRHRRLFGGGFHCFTLDTRRDGGREDYLG
ncbi:glycine amidinotransferase [Streptomyces sp. 1114.5]|uniref:glycine amidinotransferase n=1 Tax=unclassified Streptomyces TaxID=2593676 RepID=UPI000BD207E5|nr:MULTISPECIES: glycine amidinotransferase [unclassified Streptomyces]RKT19820.1 glycine amidinotransferase [Streptomyces sp. 1114.5]SOB86019.1 glycine amidinotransferase [Streptomyces sp. 1331.2]